MSYTVGKLHQTINAHNGDVNWVDFSDNFLASVSGDKTVRLWNIGDFTEHPASPLCGHVYSIHCCMFSPSGDILVTCSTDGKAIIWDGKTGENLGVLMHKSSSSIRVCRFSNEGDVLATGSDDETIYLWDIKTRKLIRTLEGHEGSVVALAFSPDDVYMVSGSTNGDLRVWDACYGHGRTLVLELDGHDLGVSCCEFSPTYGSAGSKPSAVTQANFLVATCGYDNHIKLWDILAYTGSTRVQLQQRNTLSGHSSRVMAARFSPDGKILASGGGDKKICLWDPLRSLLLHTIDAHSRYITSCAFSRDGSMLASCSNDKTVKVWRLGGDIQAAGTSQDEILVDLSPTIPAAKEPPSRRILVDVKEWSVEAVVNWLHQIGMSQYEDAFRSNAIDGQELLTLTPDALERHLGVGESALGHRNKIMRAIKQLRDQPVMQTRLDDSRLPDEYLCPITREIMVDPVIASDGYTYERAAIVSWMSSGKTRSPMTNGPLTSVDVTPNRSLKMLIQHHLQAK